MKHMEDSRTENTYLIMNKHINGYGRLFGGVLMLSLIHISWHAASIFGKVIF